MAVRDHAAIPTFLTAFLKNSQASDIAQSVSVLHGSKFVSYRIGDDAYRVGSISLWTRINMLFSEFPWLIVVTCLVVCFILATFFRAMLRRRARTRLQGDA
jgi:cellulose synthase (UDP-forming)